MAFFPTGLLERVREGGGSLMLYTCSAISNLLVALASIVKELVKISHHALHCMYSAHCTF